MAGIKTPDLPLKSSVGEFLVNTDTGSGMQTGRVTVAVAALQIKTEIDEIDGEVSVLSFGADPTGVSNSSAAFQAAMTEIGAWGKINLPAGTYKLDTPLTGNALWNLRHGVTITGAAPTLPGVTMSAPNGRDLWSGALTGSGAGEYYFNSDIFTSDSFINAAGNTYARYVKLTGRDPTSNGGRFAFGALAQLDSPGDPAMAAGTNFYAGAILQGIANYDNTATGAADKPSIYGGNSNVVATANAADWGAITCHEFDVTTYAGATYLARTGSEYVLVGTGPQGTVRDAAIVFKSVAGVTNRWSRLLSFDDLSGGSALAADGAVLKSQGAMTIGDGIDLSSCTIANYFLKGPGFTVDGDGDVLAKTLGTLGPLTFVNNSAPANQHYATFELDSNGYLNGYMLDDALVKTGWVQVSRAAGVPAAISFANKVYTPASATLAGFNMAPGSAPGTPQDGDMWPTTAALFVRINGATKTLAALETAQTWTALQTFNGGVTVAGGTLTADAPVVLSQTWNNAGVIFKALDIDITDTASNAASYLIRARKGGVDMFTIRKDGLTLLPWLQASTYLMSPTIYGGSATNSVLNLLSTSGAGATDAVNVKTGSGVTRWTVPNAGHLNPGAAATYDIGNSTTTVRALYLSDGVYNGANKIIGARKPGWGAPSGTFDRTSLAAYAGQTVSAGYVQAEAQATDNAIKKLSQVVAALINDLHASGTGSPTHMLLAT